VSNPELYDAGFRAGLKAAERHLLERMQTLEHLGTGSYVFDQEIVELFRMAAEVAKLPVEPMF
jgi:hypothetical protein